MNSSSRRSRIAIRTRSTLCTATFRWISIRGRCARPIDTNCVGAQSPTGYWNLVDYIHAHAAEMGGSDKSLEKANETLDSLTRDEGKRQKLNADTLNACIVKQDDTAIKASDEAGRVPGRGLDACALHQRRKDRGRAPA